MLNFSMHQIMSLNRQTAGHLVYQKHRMATTSIVWFLGLLVSDQQLNGQQLKIFNCWPFVTALNYSVKHLLLVFKVSDF